MRTCPKCGAQHADTTSFCNNDGTRLSLIDAIPDPDVAAADGKSRVGAVLGSYRLVELLGEGGMGYVYLAEHTRLGRRVALKMLRPEYASNANVVKRFFSEARAVNQINHENIVEISDFIENEGGENYYIMELLKGGSLADIQRQATVIPLERALGVAVQVCAALKAVHASGIIHRDLKPDNIFLTERAGQQDFVKLLDFGIAKLQDAGVGQSLAKTSAGAVIGTPEYMAPEQVTGKEIDYRADIYALGVILYEMVTSRKPLSAKTFGEMVVMQVTVTPPKPSDLKDIPYPIPAALEQLILHCLEKDPANRPQSVEEIATRLKAIAGDDQATLQRFKPVKVPNRKVMRIATGTAAAVVLAAVGVTAAMLTGGGDEKPMPEVAVAKLEIAFDSVPQGAEVYRDGEAQPLGITPFSLAVEPSLQSGKFEFRLPGYRPVQQQVPLEKSSRVAVTLGKQATARVEKPAKPAKPAKAKRRALRGTMDPFAD